MYCYQCEQTAQGTGCTRFGVCGKDPASAALQDLLVYAVKGISQYAHRAAQLRARDPSVDRTMLEGLFATVTNVDFDPERLQGHLHAAAAARDRARRLYEAACVQAGQSPEALTGPAMWQPAEGLDDLVRQGEQVSITKRRTQLGPDVAGLQDLVLSGLKGAAAYADHACLLGYEEPALYAAFHETLDFLTRSEVSVDALLDKAMQVGKLNFDVMALLDRANTSCYGQPEPTRIRATPIRGKAIVVSGHDLKDLDVLLQQTEGKGVHVYTHGEMLSCLAYPGLKKHKHLVGNYGGAWQNQRTDFDAFPGAILMTTNCIQQPKESYQNRIFTTGLVAWPGVRHIGPDRDFSPVLEAALAAKGFTDDAPEQWITIGFGHHAVSNVADRIIAAVRSKQIRHFFLIGGCDGAKSGRNYYTEFAQQVPDDCVILTLACGKYRFNKLDFGSIDGVPRLLDVGQCNDAYSAIRIAMALAEAFHCDVNQLPLSLILSWFEQKAVAILLTLLYLGIKNIRLGPSLPAFVTPTVLGMLAQKFAIAPITTPEADLAAILPSMAS